MPPRTGVEKLVVNLHWSTANVNLIVDYAESKNSVVISKDCKAIVPANITPVQKPGHSCIYAFPCMMSLSLLRTFPIIFCIIIASTETY